ncbi:DUF554 domain-containing protein [Bacillus shivajii]|uniref:DUF554 domain-containing protein n=1 Tax=Bacillus shivajii TaxID=1983719 RepID=UPI001CF93953|nr:DUF554 domain-containing protein [Bacillus shivajii]UCZ53242.1 DUF554 domain-containing protein [Bacillus shivajii]
MVLLGTLINGLAIIIGAWLGSKLKGFSDEMKETVTKGIGLAVIVLGLMMAMESHQFIIVILSLAFGGVLGERLNIEGKLNEVGNWLQRKMNKNKESNIAEGFVAATLVFVVGAMAIIGALDSGLRQDHSVLLTKSVLDGFFSIIFAATLGIGVLFSAFPVIIYQGSIALSATLIATSIPEEWLDFIISEITSVGGIMIIGIGLNIIGLTKIRIANLLPAILFVIILVIIYVSFLAI